MMEENFTLPKLNPFIKIYPAANRFDGQPQWTLYQATSNKFYKIGWLEFECLARFHNHETANDLQHSIKKETGQDVDLDDIQSLLIFLHQNGLVDGVATDDLQPKLQTWWQRAMHGYLYFTIPIFKPQKFLDRTFQYVRPFLSRAFLNVILMVLGFAIFMTLPRLDEFFHTFMQIFTMEGAILTAVVFTGIKIIHEFSHAYMAKKYGVHVPHMGIAFVVLYPVFYTEATGAWRLTDKRARMNIGLAGVGTELALAAVALLAWNFMQPGLMQMAMFSIVAISLVGSLLINLNPLMRFDGYYVLSDYLDVENLHATAIDYARWCIRKILFGLNDDAPYDYPRKMARFLTVFGLIILVYRFFLFWGIAVLVYYMFMRPLGLLAMAFELVWFIGLPLMFEFKIWWERRSDIMVTARTKITALLCVGMIALFVLPVKQTISLPSVAHAGDYRAYYAPVASKILKLSVKNGQHIKKDDVLMVLSSDALKKDIKVAEMRVKNLQNTKRRDQTNVALFRERRGLIDEEIIAAKQDLNSLRARKEKLKVMADFDGVITELEPDIREGRIIDNTTLLFRVLSPKKMVITTYIDESDLGRIDVGNVVIFRASHDFLGGYDARIEAISDVNAQMIEFPILASVNGGPIPTIQEREMIKPLNTVYEVKIVMENNKLMNYSMIQRGVVKISGKAESGLVKLIRYFSMLYREEFNIN